MYNYISNRSLYLTLSQIWYNHFRKIL
jgi:hypothetical protein